MLNSWSDDPKTASYLGIWCVLEGDRDRSVVVSLQNSMKIQGKVKIFSNLGLVEMAQLANAPS